MKLDAPLIPRGFAILYIMNIRDEFKNLLPPLSNEEYKLLSESIKKEGVREPLVLWQNILIDGHNRHQIATELGIEYQTIEMEFDAKDDVFIWMIDNQGGRRNLTDGWKYELAQSKREILWRKGREKQIETLKKGDTPVLSTIDKTEKKLIPILEVAEKQEYAKIVKVATEKPKKIIEQKVEPIPLKEAHDTRKEIAKDLGWSTGKVAMADVVWQKAEPEVKEQIKSGDMSINKAYQEIKKVEKREKLEERKVENKMIEKSEVKEKPKVFIQSYKDFLPTQNNFDLLLTDPPFSTDIDDIVGFVNDWLPLALATLKDNARGYICIGAYPKEIKAYLDYFDSQDRFILDNPLIWSYRNTLGVTPNMKYNLNYQMILHFYSDESERLDTSITNEMVSVQEINAPEGRLGNRYHKWQKPNELARRLIQHSTKEGDRIIDPFTGSGTFLVNAGKMNRIAIGCDIDNGVVELLKERGCEVQQLDKRFK